jgi:hypothetical protein
MTRLLTTTAVLLAIIAVAPVQANTTTNGLSASTHVMNGIGANGAAVENEGGFTTALLATCCKR